MARLKGAYLLLDCIFALLVISITLASLVMIQGEITTESKLDLAPLSRAQNDLLARLRQDSFTLENLETNSHKTYILRIYSGESKAPPMRLSRPLLAP